MSEQRRLCGRAVAAFLLAGLMAASAFGQPVRARATFDSAKMTRLLAPDVTQEEKAPLWTDWERFRPRSVEDVDLLYACVASDDSRFQSEGRDKLCVMRDKALIERSRTYIAPTDLDKAEVAMEAALAAKDTDAIPALRKLAAAPEADIMAYHVKEILAQLGDEQLLDELTDPNKQPQGSTLRAMNLQLLRLYGDKGTKRVKALAEGDGLKPDEYAKYLAQTSGKEAGKELIGVYRSAKTIKAKAAALDQLTSVNTAECQPIFHEVLEDASLMAQLPSDTRMMILGVVLLFDDGEAQRLRREFIRLVENGDPVEQYYAFKMLPLFRADMAAERMAALALARLLTSDHGKQASDALEKLTGQQFQYKQSENAFQRGINRDADRNKRIASRKPTAEDMGVTPESHAATEKRYRQSMEEYRVRLEKQPGLSAAEREKRLRQNEEGWKSTLETEAKLLALPPLPPPGSVGLPIEAAEKWINDHYSRGEGPRNVKP